MQPRSFPWRMLTSLFIVLLAITWGRSSRGASPPAPPAVELVESVPIETTLGNPKLKSAASTWVTVIRSASERLDLEQFYLSNKAGEPLQPVLDAIVEAAKRGVKVRLLLDSKMHETYPMPVDSLGRIPGISVRVINIGKIAGGIQHAKFFLVDGRMVYLGSQNFDWRSLEHIHEMGVLIRDTRVATLYQQVFDLDWGTAEIQASGADSARTIAWPAPPASYRDLPLKLAQAPGDTVELWPSWSPPQFSPDSTLSDLAAIVRTIDAGRHEIVAQVLQYSIEEKSGREDAIDQALRRAAARGARVKLIVSDWEAGRDGMASLESLSQVPGIEIKISSVPEWSGGYIPFARVEHCKYMVVDTLSTWVGTANWEPGYFHRTRNVSATLRNRGIAAAARSSFQASWTQPTARLVRMGQKLTARVHGMTAPPGMKVYGE